MILIQWNVISGEFTMMVLSLSMLSKTYVLYHQYLFVLTIYLSNIRRDFSILLFTQKKFLAACTLYPYAWMTNLVASWENLFSKFSFNCIEGFTAENSRICPILYVYFYIARSISFGELEKLFRFLKKHKIFHLISTILYQ